MKTPEEIKKGILCDGPCNDCPYKGRIMSDGGCVQAVIEDTITLIDQLEAKKKHLQNKICNQRRQLRLLHAMYEWALGRLQKAKLNDRAHFQRWLMERGYDLSTLELPEPPKEG